MNLACVKISIKQSKNVDVETWRLATVTSQCANSLSPTAAMCVNTSRPTKHLDTSVVNEKCHHNVIGVSAAHFQQCWHLLCANVMSWHYSKIIVGWGPGYPLLVEGAVEGGFLDDGGVHHPLCKIICICIDILEYNNTLFIITALFHVSNNASFISLRLFWLGIVTSP